MSIETEIASLTTAIRNLTEVLLASAAKALPAPTPTATVGTYSGSTSVTIPYTEEVQKAAAEVGKGLDTAPAPEPKKLVEKEPTPAAAPVPAPAPEPQKVSEDDLRVQIVELARPNMADAAFKAFLGGKLAELQGAPCSISGTGKLPKIDAKHLPTLLAAINKQLGK